MYKIAHTGKIYFFKVFFFFFFAVADDGILSEAKWLLDLGLMPNTSSATRAIGYRQVCFYILLNSGLNITIFFVKDLCEST